MRWRCASSGSGRIEARGPQPALTRERWSGGQDEMLWPLVGDRDRDRPAAAHEQADESLQREAPEPAVGDVGDAWLLDPEHTRGYALAHRVDQLAQCLGKLLFERGNRVVDLHAAT